MPHGQRDWSNIGAEETVHGLADMAELSARLWSPVTFNREGNVLYMETWDSGFREWENGSYGTGADIYISAARSRMGPYSCCMIPGRDSVRFAYLLHRFPYPVLSRFGLEFSFQVSGYLETIDVILRVFDGADQTLYLLRYDNTTEQLKYYSAAGAYVAFANDVTVSKHSTQFHTVKLVSALDTGYYQRATLNETEWNMEDYQAYVLADATDPALDVQIQFTTQADKATVAYVDDIVITQNEP